MRAPLTQMWLCAPARHLCGPVPNGPQPGTGLQIGELGTPAIQDNFTVFLWTMLAGPQNSDNLNIWVLQIGIQHRINLEHVFMLCAPTVPETFISISEKNCPGILILLLTTVKSCILPL